MKDLILSILQEHQQVADEVQRTMQPEIALVAQLCQATLSQGNKILFMGNGGSAADAQHLAAEFVGRFVKERRGLPAIALTTDTSILTAIGNDYGFERVYERQIEALVNHGDLVIGLSTSGNSPNVVRAIELAKTLGAKAVGMTGQSGGAMTAICDICLKVPSNVTARIQEMHIMLGHIICAAVDEGY